MRPESFERNMLLILMALGLAVTVMGLYWTLEAISIYHELDTMQLTEAEKLMLNYMWALRGALLGSFGGILAVAGGILLVIHKYIRKLREGLQHGGE